MEKLILILGPMKSGKSFELISFFSPLRYSKEKFSLYHSLKNIRDKKISSRTGLDIESQKIKSLSEINANLDIIGIDEVHMFPPEEVKYIEDLLKKGKKFIISGLDLDYQGKLFETVKKLLELGPDRVIYKKAFCEICQEPEASFTQIVDKNGRPVLEGLETVVPDDGTFVYRSVCRKHFVKKQD